MMWLEEWFKYFRFNTNSKVFIIIDRNGNRIMEDLSINKIVNRFGDKKLIFVSELIDDNGYEIKLDITKLDYFKKRISQIDSEIKALNDEKNKILKTEVEMTHETVKQTVGVIITQQQHQ